MLFPPCGTRSQASLAVKNKKMTRPIAAEGGTTRPEEDVSTTTSYAGANCPRKKVFIEKFGNLDRTLFTENEKTVRLIRNCFICRRCCPLQHRDENGACPGKCMGDRRRRASQDQKVEFIATKNNVIPDYGHAVKFLSCIPVLSYYISMR